MAIWPLGSKKKRQDKSSVRSKVVAKATNPYHSVELNIPYDACEEVMKLHGKRFLSAQAPMVPLPSCNQKCTCKFKHHSDRRDDDRRNAFSSGGIHYSGEKNRRLGGDRRRYGESEVITSLL